MTDLISDNTRNMDDLKKKYEKTLHEISSKLKDNNNENLLSEIAVLYTHIYY